MVRIAVLGEPAVVRGFALAGALVVEAETAGAVRTAWAGLGADVGVVVLTPAAARALAPVEPLVGPLRVVMPR